MTYDAGGNRVKKEDFDYTECTLNDPEPNSLIISDDINNISLFLEQDGSFKTCSRIKTIKNVPPNVVDGLTIEDANSNSVVFAITPASIQAAQMVQTTEYVSGDLVITYSGQNQAAINENGGYLAVSGQIPTRMPNSGAVYVDGSHVYNWDVDNASYKLAYVNFGGDGRSLNNSTETFEYYGKDHLGSTRAVMVEGTTWLLQEATA